MKLNHVNATSLDLGRNNTDNAWIGGLRWKSASDRSVVQPLENLKLLTTLLIWDLCDVIWFSPSSKESNHITSTFLSINQYFWLASQNLQNWKLKTKRSCLFSMKFWRAKTTLFNLLDIFWCANLNFGIFIFYIKIARSMCYLTLLLPPCGHRGFITAEWICDQ